MTSELLGRSHIGAADICHGILCMEYPKYWSFVLQMVFLMILKTSNVLTERP